MLVCELIELLKREQQDSVVAIHDDDTYEILPLHVGPHPSRYENPPEGIVLVHGLYEERTMVSPAQSSGARS